MMKKLITTLLTLTTLASCGQQNTEYLYDKYDGQDFEAVLALQKKQCENNNKIFKTLDESSTFSNLFTNNRALRIFKIKRVSSTVNGNQEAATAEITNSVYVVMRASDLASNGDLVVNISHTQPSRANNNLEFKNKSIIYRQEDNKKILNTAIQGFCTEKYRGTIAADFFTIVSERKNETSTDPLYFTERKDTFTFMKGHIALLHRWNSTIIETDKNAVNNLTTTWKAPDGIQELTEAQCRATTEHGCSTALNGGLPRCDLDINETHFNSKNPTELLTKFSGC